MRTALWPTTPAPSRTTGRRSSPIRNMPMPSNRGIVYERTGDFLRAIADHTEAIRINPQYANAYNNRCFARARTGQELDVARTDCDQALRLDPGREYYYDSRGLVGLKQQR